MPIHPAVDANIIHEIYWLADYPAALQDLDIVDLYSLQARIQEIPDRELDGLYAAVCHLTASAGPQN
jgi:hypothetical protein